MNRGNGNWIISIFNIKNAETYFVTSPRADIAISDRLSRHPSDAYFMEGGDAWRANDDLKEAYSVEENHFAMLNRTAFEDTYRIGKAVAFRDPAITETRNWRCCFDGCTVAHESPEMMFHHLRNAHGVVSVNVVLTDINFEMTRVA